MIGHAPSADPGAQAVLCELFEVFDAPLRLVTLEEAELIKNAANAFLALKISFANEIAGLAERAGADAGPVLDGIGLDPRIGPTMLHPSFGFGGSCLPKELQTIAISGRERGLTMHVTSAAAEANLAHQRQFAERIDDMVGGVAGRSVALLGLCVQGRHRRHPLVARGRARPLAARPRCAGPGLRSRGHGSSRPGPARPHGPCVRAGGAARAPTSR